MIDLINLEKQALKRVKNFIQETAAEENIPSTEAKVVINYQGSTLHVYLFHQNQNLKPLELKSIVEYFGQEYKQSQSEAMISYIAQLAQERKTAPSGLNIIICENKGRIGAYLYEGTRHIKQLHSFEILSHFYIS